MILDIIFYGSLVLVLGGMALAATEMILGGPVHALPYMALFQIFLLPMFVCVQIKKRRHAGPPRK